MTPVSYISGTVTTVGDGWMDVSLGTLGLRLRALSGTLEYARTLVGSTIALHTVFLITDSNMLLYGFRSIRARNAFEKLIEVKGVGHRLALMTLEELSPMELVRASNEGDMKSLMRVNGIGARVAERIASRFYGETP